MILKTFFQKKTNVLAIVCLIAIVAISLMKSAMELEDAEQTYFSQWLRLGYDDQPPLFTWLQYVINAIIGITVVSFSLLRALIFATILIILYKFSETYLKNVSKANLVVFALALIPVFIDFTFRRLSHTTLLCFVVLITYYILQRLLAKQSICNYILLGVAVGLGILTKYNYVMVIGAIGLAVFIDKNIRGIILHKYIFISSLIVGVLITPHFYWLVSNQEFLSELRSSVDLKTTIAGEKSIPILAPLLAMLKNIVKIIAPLVIVLIVARLMKRIKFTFLSYDWLVKMLLAQLIVIFLFFVLMDVQKTEERWFLPLLIPFLVLLVKSIQFLNIKKWVPVGFLIFMVFIGIQIIRTPMEKLLKIPSDVHFSFQPISDVLNAKFKNENWILPNVTYGGNIKLLNTSREVFSLDDFSLPKSKTETKESVLVVIGKENLNNDTPLDSIINFGRRKENIYFIKYNTKN
tara:strand:+ start:9079 stop:10467 length:1389 start_codon:yes stop_codon:yes gene_type:complete